MKKLFFLFFLSSLFIQAQNVTILPGGITPALSGTYPRLTYEEILALPAPDEGDMAYDTSFKCLRVYNGVHWVCTYQQPDKPISDGTLIASGGGIEDDFAVSAAVDNNGNIFLTGYYRGTANFGGSMLSSAGLTDIFIAKYNSSGSLLWIQSAGGSNLDYSNGVCVDDNGNAYITGYFLVSATFGSTSISSLGGADIFIAKYNTNGILQWVERAGGNYTDLANAIASDGTGNLYITGSYSNLATFQTTSVLSVGNSDAYIAKYSDAGVLQWVQSDGGTGDDQGRSVTVNNAGQVYYTGTYTGSADFGALTITSAGNQDIFVARYTAFGDFIWVRSAGGTSSDISNAIVTDAGGNAYLTGTYRGTATFQTTNVTSAGEQDIFLAKYTSAGVLDWVKSAGGSGGDAGYGVSLDSNGDVYLTGSYVDVSFFGAHLFSSAGISDIFIARLNPQGAWQWAKSIGSIGSDNGLALAVDGQDNVYVTGRFYETLSLGASSISSAGYYDIFLARIGQQ